MTGDAYECPACRTDLDKRHFCQRCQQDFSKTIKHNEAHGQLTPDQKHAREHLDAKLKELLQEYAFAAEITDDSIKTLRDHLLATLQAHYHVPAYDVYPWLLTLHPQAKKRAHPTKPRIIQARHGQMIEVTVPLVDQVPDDTETYAGDLKAIVRIINNQVEIEVPDVETANDAPGHAIPILVEQTNGKLHLAAWDRHGQDPSTSLYWARDLASHQALAEARRDGWEG